jgi:hypothetical protein
MLGWLNPDIAPQHFHHEVVEITPHQPSARTVHSEPESYPHAVIGMGADTVEGFTVSDAMGKAGGE